MKVEEKESMKKIMKENEKDVKHKTKSIHIDQELAHHAIVIHIYTCTHVWYSTGTCMEILCFRLRPSVL